MDFLNRFFGKNSQKKQQHPEQLRRVMNAFIRARNWREAQPIVWKHSELLSQEAATLLERQIVNAREQSNAELEDLLQERAYWLQLCHEMGLEKIQQILEDRKQHPLSELSVQDEDQELRLGDLARSITKQLSGEIALVHEEGEDAVGIPMSYVCWYATRLTSIPNVIDKSDGTEYCRRIGEEIYQKWGFDGMVTVCEYCRDEIGGDQHRSIEYAWDGIGEWRG